MGADVSLGIQHWSLQSACCLLIPTLAVLLALPPTNAQTVDSASLAQPIVFGLTVRPLAGSNKPGWQGANQEILVGKIYEFQLFGRDLFNLSLLGFTERELNGSLADCQDSKMAIKFPIVAKDGNIAVSTVSVPVSSSVTSHLYLCAKARRGDSTEAWVYYGPELRVYVTRPIIPLWVSILFIIGLFLLSGLFSGLNLGLMALDIAELKIICRAGTASEKSYAKRIIPVRKKGNWLLCSLLLGNVMVNTTLSLLLDALIGDGIYAVISATIGIVIFGEIIPQALCSRHGLAVGASTMPITMFFMALTSPLSYPLSFVLDKVLGEEFRQVFDRNKLKEFIAAQGLERTEANIILGALSLQNKTIGEVMRGLSDVYMLPAETLIDSFTIDQIRETGYTRIPIYEKERHNIINILNFKDLTIVNRDTPMRADLICEYFNRQLQIVYDTDTLDNALKLFLSNRIHLAIVKHHVGEEEGNEKDPYEVTVGLVTLEDILEEIIQQEIEDETDIPENPTAITRQNARALKGLWKELAFGGTSGMQIPVQLRMAATQSLAMLHSDLFGRNVIMEPVLEKMFEEKILVRHMFIYGDEESNTIFRRNQPCDFGIFLLEGRAVLGIGVEDLEFEASAFTFLGAKALTAVLELHRRSPDRVTDPTELRRLVQFAPDYTCRAKQNLQYLKLSQAQYATLLRISDSLRDMCATAATAAAASAGAPSDLLGPGELDERLNALFAAHFPRQRAQPAGVRRPHSHHSLSGGAAANRLLSTASLDSGGAGVAQPTTPTSVGPAGDEAAGGTAASAAAAPAVQVSSPLLSVNGEVET
ncbi:hypothetical protein BOX15_Mlig006258g1 [Macrostomum lignano]|uniref:CNNM transmembrane domain-containing protein n=2 Tax=Macrostomum lignano TaxID=282301 RepID=A0A267FY15_9PLAT|nr:hypothetical protein BOX15_Mlig006258g1 [Macrostomum lignano]